VPCAATAATQNYLTLLTKYYFLYISMGNFDWLKYCILFKTQTNLTKPPRTKLGKHKKNIYFHDVTMKKNK